MVQKGTALLILIFLIGALLNSGTRAYPVLLDLEEVPNENSSETRDFQDAVINALASGNALAAFLFLKKFPNYFLQLYFMKDITNVKMKNQNASITWKYVAKKCPGGGVAYIQGQDKSQSKKHQ